MYYCYRQNNSRGYFKLPAIHVYVEAESEEAANERFVTIAGCYFDPDCHFDCPCCGSRWHNYPEQLTAEQMRATVAEESQHKYIVPHDGVPLVYILHTDGNSETQ